MGNRDNLQGAYDQGGLFSGAHIRDFTVYCVRMMKGPTMNIFKQISTLQQMYCF